MKRGKSIAAIGIASLGMLLMILDSKTFLNGAMDGVQLCIRTVLPSLFPFIVLSGFMIHHLDDIALPYLNFPARLCRLPQGAESIWILGFLGGYPVGAKAVAQLYRKGALDRLNAQRMLGFCSNCGPSFMFGMVACLFDKPVVTWLLWLIHMVSAILVGISLPYSDHHALVKKQLSEDTFFDPVGNASNVMINICGWIILARSLGAFLDRWFLWLLPQNLRAILMGMLELANGCVELQNTASEPFRFVAVSGLLAFGGLCVLMQTRSVTGSLGLGQYLTGKLLQTLYSLSFAAGLHPILFPGAGHWTVCTILLIPGFCVIFAYRKKDVAFCPKPLYN